MIAVHLDHVKVNYHDTPIFSDLSWDIHDDRCVGLIGYNGSGKTSLLRLIAGELPAETGFVVRKEGLKIGYLAQHPAFNADHSLLDEMMACHTELHAVEKDLEEVEARLGLPEVYENAARLASLLDRQEKLFEQFQMLGGPGFEGRARSILLKLGFAEADLSLPVRVLSGGQKKLLGLAMLLVRGPNLLLLDEPDNHLDLRGKKILEQTISQFGGGVILVSHDRYLLDLVAEEIAEIEGGRLTVFSGNYSEFMFEKQHLRARQQQLFGAQQKEISRLEQAAKRLLLWGKVYDNPKFIKRGANILKRIDRMDKVEKPAAERERMALRFAGWRGSQKVLDLRELKKDFREDGGAGKALFENASMMIQRGQRVGMVGPNGCGKSVLLKMILGDLPASAGDIEIGPSVTIGYYAQEHETLAPERTLFDTVRYAGNFSEREAAAFLDKFLFSYRQGQMLIKNLSGGERSRLQLALVMLKRPNFLVLDEPTNHLDIQSAEVLAEALEDFEGTVLMVSHDRYFLDQVATHVALMSAQGIEMQAGNFTEVSDRIDLYF
ncbi:MAG: ABC-F family ATP-binding cassette domain-containing protein [Chloroflexi bacterium]|nr:ABC-F family ATP-binding cassette domain-containing protein [Chloroflexota bacterium]